MDESSHGAAEISFGGDKLNHQGDTAIGASGSGFRPEALPDAFKYDKIEVGDTILVRDDELGKDISVRVQSKKLDLLEPWKTEYEIDNIADRLPKTLRNEARRNNQLNNSVGNLMGRRVDDRKLSNSGLSVNKRQRRKLG